MNKTLLIIRREYLTRVRKWTFILLTIAGPLFYAALMTMPLLLSKYMTESNQITVVDESGYFVDKIKSTDNYVYTYYDDHYNEEVIRKKAEISNVFFLIIPEFEIDEPVGVRLLGSKSPGAGIIRNINEQLSDILESVKIERAELDPDVLDALRTKVQVRAEVVSSTGVRDTNAQTSATTGTISAILIYMFIFIYGGSVMQGVQEEKNSRIIEVIISCVKPIQLMFGKIIGVALVSLTQLVLWLVLSVILFAIIGVIISGSGMSVDPSSVSSNGMSSGLMNMEAFSSLAGINFTLLFTMFLFYFLGGYLLYSSLFAAIGAAVDTQADSQQFMLPVSIPLLFSILSIWAIVENPGSMFATVLSMIPFTSPVAMMIRLPFGVPTHEIILSLTFLCLGFILTTWLAAKIYRTGILMYGKKITYQELYKWLKYQD